MENPVAKIAVAIVIVTSLVLLGCSAGTEAAINEWLQSPITEMTVGELVLMFALFTILSK